MAGKLHGPNIPEPLLHPYYHRDLDSNHSEQDQQPNQGQTGAGTTDYITAKHYGYKHLLNDPVMTSQASIAFLCGKIQGLLRRNIPATINQGGPFHRFLSHLISEAEAGLKCSSADEQDRILKNVKNLLESSKTARYSVALDRQVSQTDEESTSPRPKRRKSVPLMPCPLQPTLKKLLHPPIFGSTQNIDTYSRYLASFDPLLIRLCAFQNNPSYLGNGLVTNVGSTFLDDPNKHPPVLIWSPPHSNSIYYSNLSDFDPNPLEFCSLEFPPEVRTPLTELSAYYSTTGHIDMVTRSLPRPNESNNASFIRLTPDHPGGTEFSQGDIHSPSLPGNATSVCLSPWVSGEWSSAGHVVSSTGDHNGFVHLYDVEHSSYAVWSGQITLDSCLDEFRSQHEAYVKSLNSEGQSDPILLDLESYMSEISVRLDKLVYKPHYSWLRVNFGSCPGELSVCSPKRILLVDTRQPGQNSMARELLTLESSSNQPDSEVKRFNLFDRLSCMPTRWLGDVYLVAGMTYSTVVLDKRMPGRCVLHWSHNLLGSPAYLDWTKSSPELVRKCDSVPTYLVPMASQYPADLSLFGLNFNSTSPVQLVGPSLMAAPLTNLLHRSENKLPSCLYRHELIDCRLQSSLCGLTTLCLPNRVNNPDHDNPVLRTVTLTSMGDLFSHSWYLEPEQADRRSKKIDSLASEWLSNLSYVSMANSAPNRLEQSNESTIVEGQLRLNGLDEPCDLDPANETITEPIQSIFWSIDEVASATDFAETSEHVQCSKHLIKDLQTIWDVAGSEQVANFAKYFPPQLLSLNSSRIAEEHERRHKADCPDTVSEERLDRLKAVVRNVLYDSESESEDEEDEEIEDDDDSDEEKEADLGQDPDLDSSLFAMSEHSSMNLSSPD